MRVSPNRAPSDTPALSVACTRPWGRGKSIKWFVPACSVLEWLQFAVCKACLRFTRYCHVWARNSSWAFKIRLELPTGCGRLQRAQPAQIIIPRLSLQPCHLQAALDHALFYLACKLYKAEWQARVWHTRHTAAMSPGHLWLKGAFNAWLPTWQPTPCCSVRPHFTGKGMFLTRQQNWRISPLTLKDNAALRRWII